MADKVTVNYVDLEDKGTCYLTNEQLDYFGLNGSTEYIIFVLGTASVYLKKVIVDSNKMNSYKLYLSKDIESQLYLKQDTVLQIKKIDDEHLQIGPYIGIFINQEKIKLLTSGKSVTEYTQINAACKCLNGLSCFFSLENIDWNKKLVQGLIREKSRWIVQTLPLPLIIYDRNVENNCRVESIELRKRLEGICKILNPMAKLAKWETIKAIEKNSKLFSIIPTTIKYKNYNDLESFLKLYPSLYLKPDSLSKGKGIFRVSKTQNQEYKIDYRTSEANHTVSLKSLRNLEILISQYWEKGDGYIIQQEINKAIFRGNTFDFRVLFQKDFQGVWQLSGAAGRIAEKGSIITSPRSGGAVEDFETILKEVFDENLTRPNGLYQNIVNLGREICLSLENQFGDCIELGLDMAVDMNKKIWLIEVNGKPLKVSLKRLGNSEIIARCNKRPIEYAVKLAGFVSEETYG
ncbi:YheC/YheD family protein [Candidatus Clostridium radicumherbarum]|uniref:YheC/YheD family protein n=1 Tax=Candidatus Clostridium radicumherbarum TaxID=3381662 RepID=A0ABW8TXB5_9CLOT